MVGNANSDKKLTEESIYHVLTQMQFKIGDNKLVVEILPHNEWIETGGGTGDKDRTTNRRETTGGIPGETQPANGCPETAVQRSWGTGKEV